MRKVFTMDFDTASFLQSLFAGNAPAAVPDVPAAGPQAAAPELKWVDPDEDIPFRTCPTCGGIDLWETIAGDWRCQHCDAAALARSRSVAAKAARLREARQ
jgi:hypothetical protein